MRERQADATEEATTGDLAVREGPVVNEEARDPS